MKYMGGKSRIKKHIIPIILDGAGDDQIYIEPFVGGGGVISDVSAACRIGIDINKYTIGALTLIRDRISEIPKNNTETNEAEYKKMRESSDIALKGYYGFALSYGGKWFGGWRRSKDDRDYVKEAYTSAVTQSKHLQNVALLCAKYINIIPPRDSIIYCDPPYANTEKYKVTPDFNHAEFWEWCRKCSKASKVFVSEYSAPPDFKCVWEKKITNQLSAKNKENRTSIERLFTYRF